MSRFLCIKIIDCNVKKFGYNEHPLVTTSVFCIFLLDVIGQFSPKPHEKKLLDGDACVTFT